LSSGRIASRMLRLDRSETGPSIPKQLRTPKGASLRR
jgi:hypothetical protein